MSIMIDLKSSAQTDNEIHEQITRDKGAAAAHAIGRVDIT